jgi:hypothetical protein
MPGVESGFMLMSTLSGVRRKAITTIGAVTPNLP